ncbi:MAG: signal peptide peptidase SppA [Candidatus Eisenbacteria bacterium]|uniref:Signal peptide peptidase SppA n=1 Tax=Eiseniibacteriota bacterium TaxID=2212470 RepID=A0A538SGZ7_UNCEI|nr:MAG: signal peptide peptidase SppA [Candidatus Eisenbacteria bacterium]TMQ59489.1 MAG: signal peptide peptidase SppA [Candidatus Eisenbacteria bacterium]
MAVKRWLVGCIVLLLGTLATVTLALLVVNLSLEQDGLALGTFSKRVGLIEIVGDIESSEGVVDQLEHMRLDSTVRAVVLRLDSPGGGVGASQEIYEAVRKVRDADKPVIASMGGVAASGAYYIACAADSIVANPGTLTGSIGVIMSFPNTEELFKKVGVRFEVVKTGKFKDIGSLSRPMTPEEKELLQTVLSNVYEQFVNAISEGRGLERRDILPYADGRIFSGDQAQAYGFVDRLGDLNDAIQLAAGMADIKGRPVVVRKERRRVSLIDLFQDKLHLVPGLSQSGPRLEYRLR